MLLKKKVRNYLPKTIAPVVDAFEQHPVNNSWEAMNVLMNTPIEDEQLLPLAEFKHRPEECYGRKVLYQGRNFQVLLVMWKPGDYCAIHTHGVASWGAVKTLGVLDYCRFKLDGKQLKTAGFIRLNARNIVAVDGEVIHQMGNPTEQDVVSLHIYGVDDPLNLQRITQESSIFDVSAGKTYQTDSKAFYELPASEIKKIESGLTADYPTWLANLTKQINRNKKMTKYSQLKNLLNELRSTDRCTALITFIENNIDPSGYFKDRFQEKIFTTAILSLGGFVGEFPEYHPLQQIRVQLDKSKTIIIMHIDDRQVMLDYSHEKLVIS